MKEFKVAFMAQHDGINLRDVQLTVRANNMRSAERYATTFMKMALGTMGYEKFFVIMTDSDPTP